MGIRDYGPKHAEIRLQPLLPYGLDGHVQVGQGVQLESARLHGGDHATGCRDAVDGQDAQRRWAVEENDRIVGQVGVLKAGAKVVFATRLGHQLRLRPTKLDAAGRKRQRRRKLIDRQAGSTGQCVVESVFRIPDSECLTEARLRVHVDHVNVDARTTEQHAQCGGGRRLGGAALLVGDSNCLHGLLPFKISCLSNITLGRRCHALFVWQYGIASKLAFRALRAFGFVL